MYCGHAACIQLWVLLLRVSCLLHGGKDTAQRLRVFCISRCFPASTYPFLCIDDRSTKSPYNLKILEAIRCRISRFLVYVTVCKGGPLLSNFFLYRPVADVGIRTANFAAVWQYQGDVTAQIRLFRVGDVTFPLHLTPIYISLFLTLRDVGRPIWSRRRDCLCYQ